MLTHGTAVAGLRGIVMSARFTPQDVLVQWIPTYHDMGLFGMLSMLLSGAAVHALDSLAFLRDPAKFLRYLSDHTATATNGPNFSYDLLAAAAPRSQQAGPLDLSRMRIAFNGAEPVSPATVASFGAALEPAGLAPSVMFPCYGMAEATLAITFPPLGRPPRVIDVDRLALAGSGVVTEVPAGGSGVMSLVSVGGPVHGMSVRVVNETGSPIGPGRLGEIQIRGDAVTTGYYRDREATVQAFDGSWFKTGDLGFMLDGELFIGGRRKEMIIVHGRNFFPEDAEAAARGATGVYRDHLVAFGTTDSDTGAEAIQVVAESALKQPDHPALAEEIRRRVSAELGLAAVMVRVVPPRYLTRTTSGKWQRLQTRDRLHDSRPARTALCPWPQTAEVTS
jgi:acyl-CoA synthetase (AMP-forming)/AMP-acid ligase II